MKRSYLKLLIDIMMTLAVILLMDPHATGLSVHEWGGLVICAVFLVHALLNWKWIACITGRFFTRLPGKSRINYCIDALLVVGFFLIVLSGMAIAKTIDFAWLSLPGTWPFWRNLHLFASLVTLLAVGAHVGLHWKWVTRQFKRSPLELDDCQIKRTQEVTHA